MNMCIGLSVLHFIFGLLYAYASMFERTFDPALMMLFVFPLSLTLTLFYAWTMGALRATMDQLRARRQSIKLRMYERLQAILALAGTLLLVYMLVTVSLVQRMSQLAWIPVAWRIRWWVSDGIPHLLYLGTFVGISVLWRPTENNERYSLDQLVDLELDLEGGEGGLEDLHELQAIRHRRDDGEGDEDAAAVGLAMGGAAQDTDEDNYSYGEEEEGEGGKRELDLEDPESVLQWMEESVGYKSPDLGEGPPPSYPRGSPKLQ